MTELDHIKLLKTDIAYGKEKRYQKHLERFYNRHHEKMIQWFELEWASLILADIPEERLEALNKLEEKYWALQRTG